MSSTTNVMDSVLPDWAKNAIDTIGAKWNAAKGNKAEQDKLHAAAEAVRSQFGYSGGVDGSKVINLSQGVMNVINAVTGGGSNNTGSQGNQNGTQQGTVNNAIDVLDPLSATGLPDSSPLVFPNITIPSNVKSYAIYFAMGIGALMFFKMIMGGKEK